MRRMVEWFTVFGAAATIAIAPSLAQAQAQPQKQGQGHRLGGVCGLLRIEIARAGLSHDTFPVRKLLGSLGWQGRVRWTLQPGNDLFFAFNQGWIQEDGRDFRFRTRDSKVSAKFQYSFRF